MTSLDRAIAGLLVGRSAASLATAHSQLSLGYREGRPGGDDALSETAVLAYVAGRLPATVGANHRALAAVAELLPAFAPRSQLDLGTGPGGAAWAAEQLWPSILDVKLVDRDTEMLRAGQQLRALRELEIRRQPGAAPSGAAPWVWQRLDLAVWATLLAQEGEVGATDLVTLGYALGELGDETARTVAEAAWAATSGCLVIVEPGTPAGFERVREVRGALIGRGATLVAPCPHEGSCPVTQGDWCHFAARVNRSAVHRQLKNGGRSFEDEKFSYVAFTRGEAELPAGRVVRRPVRRRRLVELTSCRGHDIAQLAVGRSSPGYRQAVALGWGDAVPPGLV
ncbi:MAG: small ribosomal subunit Rsm22 family protein [Acidimicrobiales bacterium]